jgi:hypothetical protein
MRLVPAVSFIVLSCLIAPAPTGIAFAQTLGKASFTVYELGTRTGTLEMMLSRTEDGGWRLQGSERTTGAIPVTIPNLDLLYDRAWLPRFMTLEMKAPDDAIVHTAVVGTTTRTDVVRSTAVRFRSISVSADTIFLPDRAYGAYEAVAARLTGAVEGTDLPLFIVPIGETRGRVDAVRTEQLKGVKGAVTAQHYVLTEIRERPTRVDVWVARGRLVRLDFPRSKTSVLRQDLIPGP